MNKPEYPEWVVMASDLVRLVRSRSLLIVAVTCLVTAGATTAGYLLPKQYEAVAVAFPTAEGGAGRGGTLGALASQLGGLTSLAGITLPGGSDSSEAVATLNSDALTIEYIEREKLIPVLFDELWDAKSGTWKDGREPSSWSGKEFFRQRVRSVSVDPKTNLISVRIRWKDPVTAAKWANDLIRLTNEIVRQRALQEADRNIAYLKDQVAKSSVVQLNNAIYSLMETQITRAMVARGSEAYALRVIDAAIPPEGPVFPRMNVWVPAGAVGGLFLGFALAVVVAAAGPVLRRSRAPTGTRPPVT